MLTLQDARHLLSQSTRNAVILLRGDRTVREIALELATTALVADQRILWMEAANIFDLYALTETAKRWGIDPHPLLRRLRIARVFTIHQMETLCTERLGPDLSRSPGALAILSDPLALCWDEEVPESEARRVLRRVAGAVEALRRKGHRLLITSPDPPDHVANRAGLISLLHSVATRTFAIRRTPEGASLQEEVLKRYRLPAGRG
jgi:hypothetical protein